MLYAVFFTANMDAPDISTIRLHITTDVVISADKRSGQHIHFCDIISLFDATLLFQIEWTLFAGFGNGRMLHRSHFITYNNQSSFREATAMRDEHLLANYVDKIGYRVRIIL